MYDAVLFDLDGTLIDTESLSMAAGLQAFASLGFAVETAFLHRLIGIDQTTSAGIIRAHLPDIDLSALNIHWNQGFRAGVDRGLSLKSGVHTLLAAVPVHIHRAVVTSSGREDAHRAGCVVVQVPDMVPASGRWAHHVAPDLMSGARSAGLL